MTTQVKKTVCTFCAHNCGMLAHVEDGKLVKIEGNSGHPFSQGFACERNRLALKWLHHSDQLMYPLKRVGERGVHTGGRARRTGTRRGSRGRGQAVGHGAALLGGRGED